MDQGKPENERLTHANWNAFRARVESRIKQSRCVGISKPVARRTEFHGIANRLDEWVGGVWLRVRTRNGSQCAITSHVGEGDNHRHLERTCSIICVAMKRDRVLGPMRPHDLQIRVVLHMDIQSNQKPKHIEIGSDDPVAVLGRPEILRDFVHDGIMLLVIANSVISLDLGEVGKPSLQVSEQRFAHAVNWRWIRQVYDNPAPLEQDGINVGEHGDSPPPCVCRHHLPRRPSPSARETSSKA